MSAAGSDPRGCRDRMSILAAMAARRTRPAGAGGASPAGTVLPGRLPDADHPAGPAGRGADGRLRSIDHDAVVQTSTARRVRRTGRDGHPDDVRRGEPPHPAPGAGAGRADPVLAAGTGGVPRHVRARIGDGRAGQRGRHRPRSNCGSATSPTSTRSWESPSAAGISSAACAAGPSCSAGRTGSAAGEPAAGSLADRRRSGVVARIPATPRRPPRPATATRTATFVVSINATDIGTGARTAMLVLAAEALDVDPDLVEIRIGDSDLPRAGVAGGSSGTTSWGWAVHKVCRELVAAAARAAVASPSRRRTVTVTASTSADLKAREELSRYAFGAQFVEVRVDIDTGEVRVPRMVGVFAAGRIVNPRTARSQLIGGMTMGLSMALHEEGVMDPAFGDYANNDLAGYHIASCADVGTIEVEWLDEQRHPDQPVGHQGDRRDRHRRNGGGGGQRRVPRHRGAGARACRSPSRITPGPLSCRATFRRLAIRCRRVRRLPGGDGSCVGEVPRSAARSGTRVVARYRIDRRASPMRSGYLRSSGRAESCDIETRAGAGRVPLARCRCRQTGSGASRRRSRHHRVDP